jgi:hypothetical protein
MESMTENQKANVADHRRATVMVLHHRRGNLAGVAVVAEEANRLNRSPQLLNALLEVHQILIALLRTQSGINLLADWVIGIAAVEPTEENSKDVSRAAMIWNFHGKGNRRAIAEVMNEATAEGRPTQVFLQLLALYEVALPELSGPGALEWLEAQIPALLGYEGRSDA